MIAAEGRSYFTTALKQCEERIRTLFIRVWNLGTGEISKNSLSFRNIKYTYEHSLCVPVLLLSFLHLEDISIQMPCAHILENGCNALDRAPSAQEGFFSNLWLQPCTLGKALGTSEGSISSLLALPQPSAY